MARWSQCTLPLNSPHADSPPYARNPSLCKVSSAFCARSDRVRVRVRARVFVQYIYMLPKSSEEKKIVIAKAFPAAEAEVVSTTDLSTYGFAPRVLLLEGDVLVVIGNGGGMLSDNSAYMTTMVRIVLCVCTCVCARAHVRVWLCVCVCVCVC